jgi:uncharacterized membrane protein YedE/YeeE
MIEFLSQPWPWYIGGLGIALVVFLLLVQGRIFGVSSSLETLCTIGGAGKVAEYFRVDWKEKSWLLIFLAGSIIGGFIASTVLFNPDPGDISTATIADLSDLGIHFDGQFLPESLFSWSHLLTLNGFLLMIGGGLLVGFGTRYAGGCTSGHAISGIADLQLPSLVATIGFFIGGLISVHLLFPIIF